MGSQGSMNVGMYSFDCRDAAALATFWLGVLMRPVDEGATPEFATIGFDGNEPTWMFHQPRGALATGDNRLMLDLGGDSDWAEQADRVEATGAERVSDNEDGGIRWVVFRDPEGNTFRIFAPRPSTYELRVERDINGAPKDVYDAFLAIYDEPLPEWVLESRRDVRVGGEWDITFRPPGLEAFSEHRVFTVVDRPNSLEYTATITLAKAQTYNTAVTFRVEQDGTVTRASLTQSGFPDLHTRDEFAAAWPDVFDMIVARLAEET